MKKLRMFYVRSTIICFAQKIGLKMKLTLLFSLIGILNLVASQSYSQLAKLTISLKDASVEQVLAEIKDNSEFDFVYNRDAIDLTRKVDANYRKAKVDNILDDLFKNTNVKYYIIDRVIVLSTVSGIVSTKEQPAKVSGKVTDSDGQPLPGVTVVLKGTTQGTVTNSDGEYSLMNIPEKATLVFSFVGMKTQQVNVDGKNQVNIILEEESIGLEEVIAIGYGEQSKARLTTSISKLDTKVLENGATANIGTALQGTIPGLRVINTTGQPGASPNILLRGGASISSSDSGSPLVVVDGVIREMNDINPFDIQSVDVLKDAASTAIYGARANNGVILITTKQGKSGKTNITYTYKAGVNKLRKDYNFLPARDYIKYQRLARYYTNNLWEQGGRSGVNIDNDGAVGFGDPQNYDIAQINDENRAEFQSLLSQGWEWMVDPIDQQDTIIFKDHIGEAYDQAFNISPKTQEHNVFLSGGNEKGQYASSINYYKEEGLGAGTMYERFSGKLTSSYNLADNFEINGGVTYSNSSNDDNITNNNFYRQRIQVPTRKMYDAEGNPSAGTNAAYGNPAYYSDKYIRLNDVTRTTLNTGASWEIIPNLFLKANGSLYIAEIKEESFNKKFVYVTGSVNENRNASASYSKSMQQQHNITLNYSKNINKHNVNLLVGGEYYDVQDFYLSAAGRGAPTDDIYTLNAAAERTSISSLKSEYRMLSGFSRLNYNFDEKYLFTAVMRYDGTSALKDNRWGAFPGLSAGWNMHNEDFFKNSSLSPILSSIKPRVSYGVNGNISGIGRYEVQGTYSLTTNYDGDASYLNTELINSGLRWEKSVSLDAGVDLGLMNNKILVYLNYFKRLNKDLLTNLPLPSYSGFSSFRTNLGTLENKGFEIELNTKILSNANGLSWNLGFNAAYVKNKIIKLPYNGVENNRQGGYQIFDPKSNQLIWVGGYQEGKSIGDIVAYKALRILRDWADVQATVPNRYDAIAELYGPDAYAGFDESERNGKYPISPGDVLWEDFDNNDIIDSKDRYVVGNIYPKWTGGFNTTISYKNFSLYGRFDYALGHIIYNDFAAKTMGNMIGNMNVIDWVYDSWSPDNPDAKYPVYLFADFPSLNIKRSGLHNSTPQDHNSQFYEKGDYLCVRELTLSYLLPQSIVTKIGVPSVQVNVTGQNLAYITREYTGWNPEEGGSDAGRYPLPATILLGVQVSFF
jgi:TonB-linked SusC/RagA family outer membrane protein